VDAAVRAPVPIEPVDMLRNAPREIVRRPAAQLVFKEIGRLGAGREGGRVV
jgi:hypothetical protein